jgi:hypothetical protein
MLNTKYFTNNKPFIVNVISALSELSTPMIKNTNFIDDLLIDCDNIMKDSIKTVVNKSDIYVEGEDKHNYVSLAPYFWPDATPNLKYINRDGFRNPEIYQITDKANFNKSMNDILLLSLVYKMTKIKKYGDFAIDIITKWFIDKETKMNPHLTYAQMIKNSNQISNFRYIVDLYKIINLLDSLYFLDDILNCETKKNINMWLSDMLEWILKNMHQKNYNNIMSIYHMLIIYFSLQTGNDWKLNKNIDPHILSSHQIDPNGEQKYEINRKDSLHYSIYNLYTLSLISCRVPDFDDTPLIKALEYIIREINEWKYSQINKLNDEDYNMLYFISIRLSLIYNKKDFLIFANDLHFKKTPYNRCLGLYLKLKKLI